MVTHRVAILDLRLSMGSSDVSFGSAFRERTKTARKIVICDKYANTTASAEYRQNVNIAGVVLKRPIENDNADVPDVIVIEGIALDNAC